MEPQKTYGIAFSSVGERVTDSGNRRFITSRSADKPKLYYFAAKGRAEVSRLLLAVAGADYEDVRYSSEQWPQHKQRMPTGTMPVLDIPGKRSLGQSGAIARYLARENGMAGRDNFERAQVDMVMGCIEDLFNAMVGFVYEKNEEAKEEKVSTYFSSTLPNMMKKLNDIAGPSYFFGNTMTVADIMLFDFVERIGSDKCRISSFARLFTICENVSHKKAIAKWLAQRPRSEF